jgi:hypothetical protein
MINFCARWVWMDNIVLPLETKNTDYRFLLWLILPHAMMTIFNIYTYVGGCVVDTESPQSVFLAGSSQIWGSVTDPIINVQSNELLASPSSGRPVLVGCLRLVFQNIHTPHLQTVYSSSKPTTGHVLASRTLSQSQ